MYYSLKRSMGVYFSHLKMRKAHRTGQRQQLMRRTSTVSLTIKSKGHANVIVNPTQRKITLSTRLVFLQGTRKRDSVGVTTHNAFRIPGWSILISPRAKYLFIRRQEATAPTTGVNGTAKTQAIIEYIKPLQTRKDRF